MAEVSSEYWAYNDPRWAADPSYGNPETMKYMGPWDQVLQSTGFKGRVFQPAYTEMADPNGGTMLLESGQQYTPEAKAAIDQLRSSGYDLRWKHPDRSTYNTYWGFVTPEGVQDIKFEGSDVGNIIKPLIKTWGAGLGLAGLGAGINSFLGGAGAGTNALAGIEALAGVPVDPAFAAGMGVDAGMAALGNGAGALTAADIANLSTDVAAQGAASTNALAPGPYQNLTPTELLQLDYATTPGLNMSPIPSAAGRISQLQPFPASTAVTPEISSFKFSTLQDLPAPVSSATGANVGAVAPSIGTIADLAGIPADAGFAAGMGVDAGMNALNLGAGAGAGVLGAGGGGSAGAAPVATAPAAVTPATAATTAPAAATVAKTALPVAAATAGAAGGGGDFLSGMSDVAATEGAGVAGTGILTKGTNIPSAVLGGGSILDKAIDLIKSPAGGAILSGVGSVVGGITQANAAEAAANQQAEAARNALALQREMFEYQKSLLEPYRTAGTAALKRLEGALGLGGPAQPQQMLEMDPGYGFRLGEGMKALERMQSARGSMLSGGAMKAGQRYAQDYASGEYGNAYNRLANIAGLGQTVGGQLGTAAQQFGTSAGNVMGQEANALAAGRIGRGSAYSGAIQGGLNAYSNYLNQQQQNQLFRDIFGRTAIGG